jgi:hypothetical protein
MSNSLKLVLAILLSVVMIGCEMTDGMGQEDSASATSGEATSTTQQSLIYPKTVVECSAFGYNYASCDAVCPYGFMATGGGCKTDTVHWEISESYPLTSVQGWHCMANEDFKTAVYNRQMWGYAVCIQF